MRIIKTRLKPINLEQIKQEKIIARAVGLSWYMGYNGKIDCVTSVRCAKVRKSIVSSNASRPTSRLTYHHKFSI